jgi:hypothetical protein
MIAMPMLTNRCHLMQPLKSYVWEWDFYDALAAFLRIADHAQRHRASALASWLPRAQGYLNVAFKHLPGLSEYDFCEAATTRELALQLRSAHLLRKSPVLSGMWLKTQLVVECARLFEHPGFEKMREQLPGEMRIIALVARSRVAAH